MNDQSVFPEWRAFLGSSSDSETKNFIKSVVKRSGEIAAYDRTKIEAGVLLACHKRPISANQISKLVDDIEVEIFSREEKEIPTNLIGELIMDKLKDLDAVAYVRFASVYREFKDVNTFMNELKKILV